MQYRTILQTIGTLATTLVVCGIFFLLPQSAHSQQAFSGQLIGYAWSETVGWIDLNCINSSSCGQYPFGISVDTNGTLSGYAWSENIGWVSAHSANLNNCPTAPCTATLSDQGLAGWMRAISGHTTTDTKNGGWDGFISLKGTNYGITRTANNHFSGYAWGHMNVGWTDFSYAQFSPSAACDAGEIFINGVCVCTGTHCTSCPTGYELIQGQCISSTGPCPAGYERVGGSCVAACPTGYVRTNGVCTRNSCPTGTFLFNGECIINCPPGMERSGTTCIQQHCTEEYYCQNNSIYHRNTSCVSDLIQDCSQSCRGAQCVPTPNASKGDIAIMAQPSVVRRGEKSQVSWNSTAASTCTVTGTNGDRWTGLYGSRTSSAIMSQTTYTLTCTTEQGSVSASANVGILPTWGER